MTTHKTTGKYAIIHADDMGMCNSENSASIKGMTEGVISSGSVMVPCPWFPSIAAWVQENPQADIGVHLTLTSEWRHYRWRPVAPINQVSSLVDNEGFLWRTAEQVKQNAVSKEVEIEIRSQIERALAFGIRPTHVDTHMGTVFYHPEFFEAYLRVAAEFNIPPMLMQPTPEITARAKRMGVDFNLSHLEAQGLVLLDRLVTAPTPGDTYEERKESFYDVLRSLKPGVTKIIVHVSGNDEEVKSVLEEWERRYHELLICIDPETQKLIDELEIELIGYKDFAEMK